MAEFLMMMLLFLKPVFSIILSIFGIDVESGQMGILYAVVGIVTYLYLAYVYLKNLRRFNKYSFWYILFCIFMLLGIALTVFRYGGMNGNLRGSFLSFGSAVIPSFLLAVEVRRRNRLDNLGKIVPIFVLALSIVSLISLFFGTVALTGLARNTNNIGYQNGSYYMAYAFGLNLYYLKCGDRMKRYAWLKWCNPVFYILAVLQFIGVILFGGRGGMVLLSILCVYYFLFERQKKKSEIQKKIVTVLGVSVIVAFILVLLKNSEINLTGARRILSFIKNVSDSNRFDLYRSALGNFAQSPLIGHGFGSVFYTVGFYSHNLFTDFLCETGAVGTLLLIAVLALSVRNLHGLNKKDPLNRFGTVIFFFGFTMVMFSGYYLSSQMIWFAVGFALPRIQPGVSVPEKNGFSGSGNKSNRSKEVLPEINTGD